MTTGLARSRLVTTAACDDVLIAKLPSVLGPNGLQPASRSQLAQRFQWVPYVVVAVLRTEIEFGQHLVLVTLIKYQVIPSAF